MVRRGAQSTKAIAADRDGWPILVGSLVRFERAGATVRAWVRGESNGVLTCEDEKRGGLRSVRASDCTVVRPTQAQKFRRGANGQQVEIAGAMARSRRPR